MKKSAVYGKGRCSALHTPTVPTLQRAYALPLGSTNKKINNMLRYWNMLLFS